MDAMIFLNGRGKPRRWTRQAMKMDAASHENGRGKPRPYRERQGLERHPFGAKRKKI